NEIAGILSYASAFDTTGIMIQEANLIDLLGKIKTQIDKDMLGSAVPSDWVANRIDVDEIRYKKDTQSRYLFEQWALGNSNVNIAGMNGIENPLVAENTLLAGDFSLGTLYVWDDLVIEMYYEGTDKRDGLVTIGAYMRENLRVQDVDKKAFVKVTDIASTLQSISPVAP
ncbi:MAG: phage major capsid protein, partial [Cyclobacteriaceae bacterium]|nr:phage major capsid protein [Cyclobacteriaceae bacterium]